MRVRDMTRRACRKDAQHDEIRDAFRSLGYHWIETYQVAQYQPGFPDGLACRRGRVLFVEIKAQGATLTADEARMRDTIVGYAEYIVVRSVDDVLAWAPQGGTKWV